jgi:hypothetical protein
MTMKAAVLRNLFAFPFSILARRDGPRFELNGKLYAARPGAIQKAARNSFSNYSAAAPIDIIRGLASLEVTRSNGELQDALARGFVEGLYVAAEQGNPGLAVSALKSSVMTDFTYFQSHVDTDLLAVVINELIVEKKINPSIQPCCLLETPWIRNRGEGFSRETKERARILRKDVPFIPGLSSPL